MLPYNFSRELDLLLHRFAIIAVFILVLSILLILAQYIMQSAALTHIGRRRGIKQPWLVWIPIARNYGIGAIADEYDKRIGINRRFRVLLLVFILAFYAAYMIFCAGTVEAAINLEYDYLDMGDIFDVFGIILGAYAGMVVIVIMSLIYSALNFICLYKIYESLSPRHCVLHFILSMFIPLYMPISLLCLRNSGYPYPEEALSLPEICEKGWYEA